jgi:hypothetical protein
MLPESLLPLLDPVKGGSLHGQVLNRSSITKGRSGRQQLVVRRPLDPVHDDPHLHSVPDRVRQLPAVRAEKGDANIAGLKRSLPSPLSSYPGPSTPSTTR